MPDHKMKVSKQITLILPDIRSAQNVGAIFRTADAVGVNNIYLTGYTPTPLDKYGRPRSDIAKASLGAELSIPWEYKKALMPLLKKLKKDGYKVVALEQSDKSIDYKKLKVGDKTVLILGNEVDGINNKILNECDTIIEIPMKGIKESLNVSVATGVALFRILNI
jgi:tRNA G18 (ribose-2'-O)-methylase SpoU